MLGFRFFLLLTQNPDDLIPHTFRYYLVCKSTGSGRRGRACVSATYSSRSTAFVHMNIKYTVAQILLKVRVCVAVYLVERAAKTNLLFKWFREYFCRIHIPFLEWSLILYNIYDIYILQNMSGEPISHIWYVRYIVFTSWSIQRDFQTNYQYLVHSLIWIFSDLHRS